MKSVWILFSVANDYNQPDRAFEELFWEKPTLEDLKKYVDNESANKILQGMNVRSYGGDWWIEKFTK